MPLSSVHQHYPKQHQAAGDGSGGSSPWSKKKPATATGGPSGLLALDHHPASFSDEDYYYHGAADENPDPLVQRSPVAYPMPQLPIVHRPTSGKSTPVRVAALLRSLFPPLQMLLPKCQHLMLPSMGSSLGRKRVTGTLYGHRRGRVTFAVQDSPASDPLLLLELAVATGQLVKEMASGSVRVLLESERQPLEPHIGRRRKHQQSPAPASPVPQPAAPSLWEEPVWTMFCNGRRSGYAVSHPCGDADLQVLKAIQAVSAGAGVLPVATPVDGFPPVPLPPSSPFLEKGRKGAGNDDGGPFMCGGGCDGGWTEVMYMRARFERVVGSRDSEAFYMMSPDGGKAGGGGGPELSLFLLRL